jgi:ribosomal protein S18 acetylase RimI-like enzyme
MFDDGADRTRAATPAFVDYEPRFLDELVAVWREAFEFGVGVSDPHPLAEQRAHFVDDLLPTNRVTLALRDDRLAGFVAASAESVAQLHVRVAMHGQGIGSSLLELAKERSSGSLWLYAFARNVRACRFYEARGFVAVERGFEPTWQLEDVRYWWRR